ncbi:MAG: hypothetical protein WA118_00860 [Carboxydocellales bacterium]
MKQRCEDYADHIKLIESYRLAFNTNLDRKRFHKISSDVAVLPGELNVAATSIFYIGLDMEGHAVNDLPCYISPTFFTVFPQKGYTYVIFSYFSKDKSIFEFINKQITSKTTDEIKVIVSNIFATYIENFFISPELWDNLPSGVKERFYKIFRSNKGNRLRSLAPYRDFSIFG